MMRGWVMRSSLSMLCGYPVISQIVRSHCPPDEYEFFEGLWRRVNGDTTETYARGFTPPGLTNQTP